MVLCGDSARSSAVVASQVCSRSSRGSLTGRFDGALARTNWPIEVTRRFAASAGDHPPRKEAQLREFVASIGVPELVKALDDVEFPEPISMWRDTRSRLRDFAGQPERPETLRAVPGLFLAGDWIATGLPATIESAVRSGHRAADAALAMRGSRPPS